MWRLSKKWRDVDWEYCDNELFENIENDEGVV